ncbi:YdcH family protein [Paracoccus pacificus]|uniref:YdcH family protein n=1 Tax=Paracoccus pacificus TaxID=1463598 RepID=A0ABW4RAN8_9RHOB
MNAPMEMSHEEVARMRLNVLRREHRDLDEAIAALANTGTGCSLTLQRLKKQKLALKDRIARLEDELTPDIIA